MNNHYKNLYGKIIAITGANGLIGQECVNQLLEINNEFNANIKIIALVRDIDNCKFPQSVIIEKYDLMKEINVEYNYIIHLAGNATPKKLGEMPYNTSIENAEGMKYIISTSIKNNAKVLYVSTCEVYGESKRKRREYETSSFDSTIARNCYPISKIFNENLCAGAKKQYNLKYNIVRPCFIYSENYLKNDNRVIPQFVESIKTYGKVIMKSNGTQKRMYLHVSDCVKAMLLILSNGEDGEIYNIPGEITSIKNIAKILSKLSNSTVCRHKTENKGTSTVKNILINGDKVKKLGWQSTINLKNGLKKLLKANMK